MPLPGENEALKKELAASEARAVQAETDMSSFVEVYVCLKECPCQARTRP